MKMFTSSMNYGYIAVFLGNILAMTGDASMTWTSPIIPKLNSTENPLDEPVTENELSWIAPMAGLGSLVGVLPFIFLPDLIGRKASLLLLAVPHMLSFGLAAFAKTITTIYIARFFGGISSASCYIVLPMYIAEISEHSNRGMMLASFTIFSNFGALITNTAGPLMSMFWFNIFLLILPVSFFISFLLVAPESPYYFVRKGDYVNALSSIEKLRCNNVYKNTESELKNMTDELNNLQRGNILNTLKKKHALKGCLIACILTTFQQFSGYSVFIQYTQTIFAQAGNDKTTSVLNPIIVSAFAFFASFLCPFVIDNKGRKFVLITSLVGMIISEICFGFFYYFLDQNYDVSSVRWISLVCLVFYMLFYTFGLGPLPLTIVSEILPMNVKFFISTLSGLLGTLASIATSKSYLLMNETLRQYGTLWLFAGCCTFLLVFVVFMIPETKGKSFQEIIEELDE